MEVIVPELQKVKYLERIVVILGRATREQYFRARSRFNDFYTPVTLLWVDSPRVHSLFGMLEERFSSSALQGWS